MMEQRMPIAFDWLYTVYVEDENAFCGNTKKKM